MKLSSREKTMLMALGIVAVIALSYFFLAKPQLEKLDKLVSEREKYKVQVAMVKSQIALSAKLDKEIEELKTVIAEKSSRFYPEILQDKLIVTLDSLFRKSAVKADSASFTVTQIQAVEPFKTTAAVPYPMKDLAGTYRSLDGEADKSAAATNTAPEAAPQAAVPEGLNQLESMAASIQYKGSYEQLMQFVKALEGLNRTVVVKNLAMAKGADNNLQGSIQINVYALPKILDQDRSYFNWPYKSQYGKANPFIQ